MPVSFDIAYDDLMKWEDSHPISGKVTTDAGGMTRYGISSRAFPKVDIANLTPTYAKTLTSSNYWRFSQMPYQILANKSLNMSFQFGLGTFVQMLKIVLIVLDEASGALAIYEDSPVWNDQLAVFCGHYDVDMILAGLRTQHLDRYIKDYNGIQHVPENSLKRALA